MGIEQRQPTATTAKPFPASPALAASIDAFKANKFVWKEIISSSMAEMESQLKDSTEFMRDVGEQLKKAIEPVVEIEKTLDASVRHLASSPSHIGRISGISGVIA